MTTSRPEPSKTHIIGVGEAMLRLSPAPGDRLEEAAWLHTTVGGAELNALIAATRLGTATTWVSRLSTTALGRRIAVHAQHFGVRPLIDWDPQRRLGTYFLDPGVHPRPTEIVYDRVGSAASAFAPGQVDWARHLGTDTCLHVSGITVALGDGPRAMVEEALTTARDRGAQTSFDVNYRARLWSEEEAAQAIRNLLDRIDVLFASPHDLERLLGLSGQPVDAAQELRDRHSISLVAIPERRYVAPKRSASVVTAVTDDVHISEPVEADVVDPIGAGDALAGTLLCSYLQGLDLDRAVAIAARASALKQTTRGDALVAGREELDPSYGYGREVLR